MPTAAMTSTAVEAAATAAVESTTAVVSAAGEAVGFATSVAVASASRVARMSIVAAMPVVAVAVVTAATVESAAIIAAMEPGAGAYEDAADEVVRPIVAVRSAGVRIGAVITISAGRCWPDGAVYGTYSNAHPNLGVSTAHGKKQNSQQSNKF